MAAPDALGRFHFPFVFEAAQALDAGVDLPLAMACAVSHRKTHERQRWDHGQQPCAPSQVCWCAEVHGSEERPRRHGDDRCWRPCTL